MKNNIIIYGDPHGNYKPLIDACQERRPDAVLILGDMTESALDVDEVTPVRTSIAPILDMDVPVRWIPGNHDGDNAAQYMATFGSYPEGNIHGCVSRILGGRLSVAGLGGVFRGRVYFPLHSVDDPHRYYSPAELAASALEEGSIDGEFPIRHHVSVYKSQVDTLRQFTADILITHEAPSSLNGGFLGIDELADDIGAKVIFHGHHHVGYEDELMNGIRVRGVGQAEVVRIEVGAGQNLA